MPKHIMGDLSTEGTEDTEEAAGRLAKGGRRVQQGRDIRVWSVGTRFCVKTC
jgi:hypothetical protein